MTFGFAISSVWPQILSKNPEEISVRSDMRYRTKINLNSILIITVLMLPPLYKKLEMRFFYCAYDATLKIPQVFTLPNTTFLGLVTVRKQALKTKLKTHKLTRSQMKRDCTHKSWEFKFWRHSVTRNGHSLSYRCVWQVACRYKTFETLLCFGRRWTIDLFRQLIFST